MPKIPKGVSKENIQKIVNLFNSSKHKYAAIYDKTPIEKLATMKGAYNANRVTGGSSVAFKGLENYDSIDDLITTVSHEMRHSYQRFTDDKTLRTGGLFDSFENFIDAYKDNHDLFLGEVDAHKFSKDKGLIDSVKNYLETGERANFDKRLDELQGPLFDREDTKKLVKKLNAPIKDKDVLLERNTDSIALLKEMGYSHDDVKDMFEGVETVLPMDDYLKDYDLNKDKVNKFFDDMHSSETKYVNNMKEQQAQVKKSIHQKNPQYSDEFRNNYIKEKNRKLAEGRSFSKEIAIENAEINKKKEIQNLVDKKTKEWNIQRDTANEKELQNELKNIKTRYDKELKEELKAMDYEKLSNYEKAISKLEDGASAKEIKGLRNKLEGKDITKFRDKLYKQRFEDEVNFIVDDAPISYNINAHNKNLNAINAERALDGIDPHVDNKIAKQLKKEVANGNNYINSIKGELFNSEGTIKSYDSYSKVVRELRGMSAKDEDFTNMVTALGLDDVAIRHPEKISDRSMKKMIKRTYDGGDVDEYIESMRSYLPLNGKTEEAFRSLVEEKGNILRNEQRIEDKIINRGKEKTIKRVDKMIDKQERKVAKAQSKKEKKITKKAEKQQNKARAKLRKFTDTEGGTLSDVIKGKASGMTKFNVGLNAIMTLSEYKEGRNEGKTVLGAAADAAVSFVGMEMLGMWGALGLGAIKGATTLAAKTAKYTIESSRSMNNIQRFTPFADAQFQDTQQLATMRQSGMELAKMSQYNLQQTLMGTEARNLHR